MNIPKILKSSVDPDKLSLTVKGLLLGLIPLAVFISARFGFNIVEADWAFLLESALALLAAFFTVWGAIRRILNKIKKK